MEPDQCNKHVIAYYKFDRSYRDVCFGHNAINEDGINSLHPSTGISNAAAQFGVYSTTRLKIPSLNAYTWGSKFSVSFWFKKGVSSSCGYYGNITNLISNGPVNKPNVGSWEIYITTPNKGQEIFSASVLTSRGAKTWENITTIISHHWHHMVMTYDGMTINFYYNSHLKLTDSECCYGDIVSRSNNVVIGDRDNGDNYKYNDDECSFEGYIDELKLFKKAMTAREVLKLYQLKVV